MSGPESVYQLHLGEKTPEIVYQFNAGVYIYPLHSGRGVLRQTVTAIETKMRKRRATVYQSLCQIELQLFDHCWSLSEGTLFVAYKNKRHEIEITEY